MTTVTEEELRQALGKALISLNKATIKQADKYQLLLFNKIALRLIAEILKELNISIDG